MNGGLGSMDHHIYWYDVLLLGEATIEETSGNVEERIQEGYVHDGYRYRY